MSIPLIDIDRHEKFIGGTFVLQYTISSLLFGFFGNRNVNKRSVEFFLFLFLFITHFIYCVMISLYPFANPTSHLFMLYGLKFIHLQLRRHFKCVTKTCRHSYTVSDFQ